MKKLTTVLIGLLMLAFTMSGASAHGTKQITNQGLTVGSEVATGKGTFTTGSAGHIYIYVGITMYRDGNAVSTTTKSCQSSIGTCTQVSISKTISCTGGHTAKAIVVGSIVTPNEGSVSWTSATKSCVNRS